MLAIQYWHLRLMNYSDVLIAQEAITTVNIIDIVIKMEAFYVFILTHLTYLKRPIKISKTFTAHLLEPIFIVLFLALSSSE